MSEKVPAEISVQLSQALNVIGRFASAVAFFGVAGIALWFVALSVQGEAVRRCFAA